ncbi:MAG TPA: acetyl-CoA carboxylase, carboxyltransferase subunit beta [Chloroflexia bacterium]|nr:acetyl-CoA carboxylase, carboxyltransferase subunit beta [Chloroflexia bacterium]
MRDLLRRPRYFSIEQGKRQDNRGQEQPGRDAPEDIWTKCPKCNELLYIRELENNLKVCQKCGYHFRLSSPERIEYLVDEGSFEEHDVAVAPLDPIEFVSLDQRYATKLQDTQAKTHLTEAVVLGTGQVEALPCVVMVTDFRFFGGSMGSVYGEKLARAADLARQKKVGLVTVSASGGARMQEGILSLMQMSKTTAALADLSEAKLPHISVLTDPCMGGVTASYASSADVVMAEPGALIGFAGPRVLEQTIKQKLPPDFQTAEFLLKHGMLDMVAPRRELRATISKLLGLYAGSPGEPYAALTKV